MNDNIIKKKVDYRVWIVVVVLILAATVIYFEYPVLNNGKEPVINIITYSSLFQYGSNPNATLKYVFGNFENWYHVKINIIYASGDIMTQLLQTKGQGYDIAIGLSNLDAYSAEKSGLLYNFSVSNESYVNSTLFNYMGSREIVPYEYSFLTNDFNYSGPINTSIIKNLSYMDLYNKTIAAQYVTENPISSITGEEFLLGQIAFYSSILKENWTLFWKNARGINITEDWSNGFTMFENGQKQIFYSYITDPSYNYYFNYTKIGTVPFNFQSKSYAWMEVLGVGILNSSKNKALDEEFVNWFLGKHVQDLIPLNEWMYPASTIAAIPACYAVNPSPNTIIPLNTYMNVTYIGQNIEQWLLEWEEIEG